MSCNEWLDMMLEAEPAELSGRGQSALARHLRSCAGCRAQARLLLRAVEQLDQSLADDAGRAAVAPSPVSRRLRRAAWLALPLAAAATLALVLLGRFRTGRGSVAVPVVLNEAAAVVPTVTPPAGRDAAVIQTDNPDIVIVWLY